MKNLENIRKANMIFGKNGNGAITTKITIPVVWAKELEFSEDDKSAIIELQDDKIIIKKGEKKMKLFEKEKFNYEENLGKEFWFVDGEFNDVITSSYICENEEEAKKNCEELNKQDNSKNFKWTYSKKVVEEDGLADC